ncbi:hypothetical protein GCM10009745_43280 [Kribbella yunnanensis]|uniref:FAD-dependent urate hydroxylase HpyO/Asp monooxygenase CreE-like FAD/NAD(P)-binding domain-containing protein n=1 Tax=Kribbella yunnanensis TaxID=190194 RepID=A0ABN2HT82_9ACTN
MNSPSAVGAVAVIGGGPAAVGLLGSMLARAGEFRRAPRVVIYEPDNLGHGVAFGPDLESALINLPNGRMSMDLGDPDQFVRWLGPGGSAEGYVPRQVFGEYLVDEFWRLVARARELQWTVEVVPETVTSLAAGSNNDLLARTRNDVRSFTHVVLGVGSGTTADPYRLTGAPNYVADPYPLAATLPGIAPPAHVLVIGTGLTAIDVALGLLHLGHRGRITLTSRNGILPSPRPQIMPLDPKHLTIETVRAFEAQARRISLRDVWELLKLELTSAGFDADREISWLLSSSPADRLRYQLDRLDAAPIQSIFENLETPVPPMIRAALAPDEMQKVAFDYKPYLKSIQCPMPPASGRTLLAAMDSGQLVVASGVTAISRQGGAFSTSAYDAVPAAQVVIDATRLSPRRTNGRARGLLDSLSTGRLATWNSFDGLVIDPHTCRVAAAAPHRLYAYGEITAGELYYASSLPAVVRGANVVAGELVRADRQENKVAS